MAAVQMIDSEARLALRPHFLESATVPVGKHPNISWSNDHTVRTLCVLAFRSRSSFGCGGGCRCDADARHDAFNGIARKVDSARKCSRKLLGRQDRCGMVGEPVGWLFKLQHSHNLRQALPNLQKLGRGCSGRWWRCVLLLCGRRRLQHGGRNVRLEQARLFGEQQGSPVCKLLLCLAIVLPQ